MRKKFLDLLKKRRFSNHYDFKTLKFAFAVIFKLNNCYTKLQINHKDNNTKFVILPAAQSVRQLWETLHALWGDTQLRLLRNEVTEDHLTRRQKNALAFMSYLTYFYNHRCGRRNREFHPLTL